MAIISRFRAVAMVGKLRLTGVDRLADVAGACTSSTSPASRTGSPRCCTGRSRSSAAAAPSAPPPSSRSSPGPRWRGCKRGAADLVSDPGAYDAAREMLETTRRAELEARAPEEARLTDAGERGAHCSPSSAASSPAHSNRSGAPVVANASRAHLGRMNTPSASTVTPSASLSVPLGVRLDPLDPVDVGLAVQVAQRRTPAGSAGSGSRSCRACRPRRPPRRGPGRGPARRRRRAPGPAAPRRPRRGGSRPRRARPGRARCPAAGRSRCAGRRRRCPRRGCRPGVEPDAERPVHLPLAQPLGDRLDLGPRRADAPRRRPRCGSPRPPARARSARAARTPRAGASISSLDSSSCT